MDTIHFTPLGGVGEIGANSYLVEIGGLRILLDCGLHPKKEGRSALPDFSRLTTAPDAVLISHAHIDHCGALPQLLKLFPATVPYATAPTLSIMDRMLHNSVSVMGILKDERGIEEYPLYEHTDVDAALRRAYGIDMDQEFAIAPGSPVRVRFSSAGHVLGSATIRLSTPEHILLYTGDICTANQELMVGFTPPESAGTIDTLVIETTYGANEEADSIDYQDEIARFAKEVAEVLDQGGAVLAPAFALGRSQELLNIISRLQDAGTLPHVPVYASGLGRALYEVYNKFSDHLNPEVTLSPLSQFKSVGDVWDPKVTQELIKDPCIIVATSGMMIQNTPSAMIAQEMVRHRHHGIFFVGYCDPDTLGHKLREARKGDRMAFTLDAPPVEVVLENIKSFYFSAHAPRKDLRRIVQQFAAKNLVLVHGDPPAIEWMHDNCGDGCAKYMPEVGETIRLRG